jgi:hypothetical protein
MAGRKVRHRFMWVVPDQSCAVSILGYAQTCHILSGGAHQCHEGGWSYGIGRNTAEPSDCG